MTPTDPPPELVALQDEYLRLSHAVQTGVKFNMETDPDRNKGGTSPKMLRTGINMAMCAHAAVAELLVEKGVITPEEYYRAICRTLRAEVERYQAILTERLGRPVTLA